MKSEKIGVFVLAAGTVGLLYFVINRKIEKSLNHLFK